MEVLKKGVEAKMDGLNKGLEANMDGLKNGMEANMDGSETSYFTKNDATLKGCATLLYKPRVLTKLEVIVLYTQ